MIRYFVARLFCSRKGVCLPTIPDSPGFIFRHFTTMHAGNAWAPSGILIRGSADANGWHRKAALEAARSRKLIPDYSSLA